MKKTQGSKKITLNKETLLRLQPRTLDLRDAQVGGGSTGPSCDEFKHCTLADCASVLGCSGTC